MESSMTARDPAGVQAVLAWLERTGTAETRAGMARYAIPSHRAYGVTVGELKKEAKRLGRDHELALALWETGRYEARILAAFVGEPGRVTVAQMEAWCADFDSWAICDTVCFHLFDRTPHAWDRIGPWARRKGEFQKRAAFALLWGLSVHDKAAPDDAFLDRIPLIEAAAADNRAYVWKGVDMALRTMGKRNPTLHAAALEAAERLAAAEAPSARRIGRSALRELRSPAVARRLAKQAG
jgi:3-methyladenine DNA glycosylase AlkD